MHPGNILPAYQNDPVGIPLGKPVRTKLWLVIWFDTGKILIDLLNQLLQIAQPPQRAIDRMATRVDKVPQPCAKRNDPRNDQEQWKPVAEECGQPGPDDHQDTTNQQEVPVAARNVGLNESWHTIPPFLSKGCSTKPHSAPIPHQRSARGYH